MENDIQKQIEQLRKRTVDRDKARLRAESNTRFAQVKADANVFYRFWLQFVMAMFWIWQNIFRPISSFLWVPIKYAFSLYKKVWSFFVYRRNEFGDLKFSSIRAGIFLLTSIPFLYFSTFLAFEGTVFIFTKNLNETIYLFNSSDNSFTEDDEFSVTGCSITDIDPSVGFKCDSEDTLYFRVKPGVVEHVWSLTTKGHVFYSDAIASAIAPGWNICKTDSWFFRFKTLIRNTNIYPKLLSASCRPLLND